VLTPLVASTDGASMSTYGPMASDIYAVVGERIQALRKERGLTQMALAERADIAVSYLVKLEAGSRKARLEVFERIMGALGEPLWRLFTSSRLTADEKQWRAEERRLAKAIRPLAEDDLRALVTVADQLAAKRRSRR